MLLSRLPLTRLLANQRLARMLLPCITANCAVALISTGNDYDAPPANSFRQIYQLSKPNTSRKLFIYLLLRSAALHCKLRGLSRSETRRFLSGMMAPRHLSVYLSVYFRAASQNSNKLRRRLPGRLSLVPNPFLSLPVGATAYPRAPPRSVGLHNAAVVHFVSRPSPATDVR